MLIWGAKTIFKLLGEGVFNCPTCGPAGHFRHKQARRWFTLFFIPVFPFKDQGRHVECANCGSTFHEGVLGVPVA
jgi:predicted RNA-binding Zn-ribbon protein involved in translation (DUF1610 family)